MVCLFLIMADYQIIFNKTGEEPEGGLNESIHVKYKMYVNKFQLFDLSHQFSNATQILDKIVKISRKGEYFPEPRILLQNIHKTCIWNVPRSEWRIM